MRLKAPRRKVVKDSILRQGSAALIICLLFLVLSGSSHTARAQEPGVTVINVPPEFSALDIRSKGGLHYVDIVVSDYNSWADIFTVDLEILKDDESKVAQVIFQQYQDNASTQREIQFLEALGQILVRDLSLYAYNADPVSIAERSEMRITFVISPVEARWLRVTATDREGLFAIAQVEYLTGTIGREELIHPLVMIMVALALSVVVVAARLRRERFGV